MTGNYETIKGLICNLCDNGKYFLVTLHDVREGITIRIYVGARVKTMVRIL